MEERKMKNIDLRSDTVTHPTGRMMDAALAAEFGDDVYGDDLTTNELQRYAAHLLGKEDALFVPSGTFCNQLALFTHCQRSQEVILPYNCHIIQHEAGGGALIAGVQFRTLVASGGVMDLKEVESTIRKAKDIHEPSTGLITYENAASDGKVAPLSYMKDLYYLARDYHIPVHLDGARFFNAVEVLGIEPKEAARYVDTINICLSKGLCAPAGSLLVGDKSFIEAARWKRKLMGGGMRQTGILAGPGIIALREMRLRLIEDHENAKYLAEKLSSIDGIKVAKDRLVINMVFFEITDKNLMEKLTAQNFEKHGILVNPAENGEMRFVTHYYITPKEIDFIYKAMVEIKNR